MGSIILFHGDLQTSLITLNKSPSTKVDISKDLSRVIEMEKNFNSENEKSYALHLMQKIRRAEQDKKFEVKYKNKVHNCTGLNEYIWIPAPEVLMKYSIISKIIPPIENIATHINTGKPSSTRRQPVKGVMFATQKKPHSTPRTEQNEPKARDDYHKWNKSNKAKSRKMEISQCI